MIQIRYGCFETNSSSTHSLIIANDEEYKKLKSGELFIRYEGFVSREEVIQSILDMAEEYSNDMKELLKEEFGIDVTEITKEFLEQLNLDAIDALAREFLDGARSYYGYFETDYLDSYEETYESQHGDKIHIFGLYGRDG